MTPRPADPVAVLVECAGLLLPDRGPGYHRLINIAEMVDRGLISVIDAKHNVFTAERRELGYTTDERAAFALAREALAPVAEDGMVTR